MDKRIDFAYAFGTPHRLTVARPDSGDKTLLDAQPGCLRVSWTYDDLTRMPLGAFMTPAPYRHVLLEPRVDGHPFASSIWARVDGYLPMLDYACSDPAGRMELKTAACELAAITRVDMANTDRVARRFELLCGRPEAEVLAGYNPNWVDPDEPADVLLAAWGERADRILIMGCGADAVTPKVVSFTMSWDVQPGESRAAWIIRPHRAYAADYGWLGAHDWAREYAGATREWRSLLGRAARLHIPDPGVKRCFMACLADIFIMREPVADGYIAPTPGTEAYRAPNPAEPLLGCIALDQLGLHGEAELASRMSLEQQEDDGNWTDPRGWSHLVWAISGFKSWTVLEHYRLTGDRAYLEGMYPRLAASTRWQARRRARTRVLVDGARTPTYGLMPRGMGDCGLADGDDIYGVFYPHNMWSLFADRLAAEAAGILGKDEDAAEFRAAYERGRADLLASLGLGAIREPDYRWIPGTPNKTSGSRWGVLNAVFPCRVLSPDDPLVRGTMRHIEARLGPGGLPLNTGWLVDGMWVAATLDNVAQAHLAGGDGDAAADYLYKALNHATPLVTWCEERGQDAGTTVTAGDLQHLWTPVAVVRLLRDSLVMEEGDTLHLARGVERGWLASGQKVGIADAPTHFGAISYELAFSPASSTLTGAIAFPDRPSMTSAVLHLRLPKEYRVASVRSSGEAAFTPGGEEVRWDAPEGVVTLEAIVVPA